MISLVIGMVARGMNADCVITGGYFCTNALGKVVTVIGEGSGSVGCLRASGEGSVLV